jgi:hypothetical protein
MQEATTANHDIKLLTETQAAQAMWTFYKSNKSQIHRDVREFRDAILAKLMQGDAVEKVFAPFMMDPEPVVTPQNNRKK